jgi:predicted heme/steroid binding protein
MTHHALHTWTTAMVVVLPIVVFAMAGCGQSNAGAATSTSNGAATTGTPSSAAPSSDGQSTTFTLDELATFTGQNGKPAYVAVDGVVYNVTDSSYWKAGKHSTCNLGAMAGQDLSDLIKQAPARMRSDLQRMPVVGSLVK